MRSQNVAWPRIFWFLYFNVVRNMLFSVSFLFSSPARGWLDDPFGKGGTGRGAFSIVSVDATSLGTQDDKPLAWPRKIVCFMAGQVWMRGFL